MWLMREEFFDGVMASIPAIASIFERARKWEGHAVLRKLPRAVSGGIFHIPTLFRSSGSNAIDRHVHQRVGRHSSPMGSGTRRSAAQGSHIGRRSGGETISQQRSYPGRD